MGQVAFNCLSQSPWAGLVKHLQLFFSPGVCLMASMFTKASVELTIAFNVLAFKLIWKIVGIKLKVVFLFALLGTATEAEPGDSR